MQHNSAICAPSHVPQADAATDALPAVDAVNESSSAASAIERHLNRALVLFASNDLQGM